jgi:prefoldin subunit 5
MKKGWHEYVGIRAAIIIAAGGVIVAGMHIWHARSELKRNNEEYTDEITEKDELINTLYHQLSQKDSEIQRLETQLTPFRALALDDYPGSEQEALKQLADEVQELRKDIDPLKKAISYAVANVEVIIKSEEQVDTTYVADGGLLAFAKDKQSLLLVSDTKSSARQNGKGEVLYKGNFQIQSKYSEIGKPVESLRESDLIQIQFNKIPENSTVLGGKASVIVNGDLRFDFEVPSQQMDGNKIIIREIKSKFLTSQSS